MNREFYEMQQDAVNRVRDMQKRARDSVNRHDAQSCPIDTKTEKPKISQLFNLKRFEGSQEDILILSLVILLADEGADIMLVLALLYLIL